jgi:diguanylate cyclase (GGDEF)-like protein
MLILIAGQSAAVIQRLLMYEEMARLAITDDLTSLCNRRHFLDRLKAEIDRARRYEQTFSVAMLDIDNFKVVNDTYGHGLGDRILADMGRLLRKSARSSDLAARYGGEEFVIMMPMTGGLAAQMAGDRLREAVASHTFPRRKKLTVSVGLATYPEDGASAEELLHRADATLYEAKRSGRNCVVSARGRLAA